MTCELGDEANAKQLLHKHLENITVLAEKIALKFISNFYIFIKGGKKKTCSPCVKDRNIMPISNEIQRI